MAETLYSFRSYVRTGFANAIAAPDVPDAALPALASVTVHIDVEGAGRVEKQVVLHGPGDVTGIAPAQIVRTDPIDGAVGVEPNYFAQIEFDRPDFPWMFTPASAAGERLRPWLVLIVVDADDAQAVEEIENASPLPRLRVPVSAAGQLPDLAHSHLWAHTQVIAEDGQTAEQFLSDPGADPRRAVSRLLCPRHLSPFRSYLAAVVPAFDVGRLAGLGFDPTQEDEQRLAPAWQPNTEVELPVYYSWRFHTGDGADFESLARQLKGRPLPEGVGIRSLDVSRPGADLPELPEPTSADDPVSTRRIGGALRPPDAESPPADEDATLKTELRILLNTPADQIAAGNADPIVAPPIYGDKHAVVVELGAGTPPWLIEVNLEVRDRVAAALGTRVVKERQEEYVARAWRQLGDVIEANRLRRGAQFSRSALTHVYERLANLQPAEFLTVAAPVHGRVAGTIDPGVTLARTVAASMLPTIAVEPSFRRLVRPSSSVSKAAALQPADGGALAVARLETAVVDRFAEDLFAAPIDGPNGVVSMFAATEVIGTERASTVLSAIDAQLTEPAQLDTALETLSVDPSSSLFGAIDATAPLREDIGSISLVTTLGAVTATEINFVLEEASIPKPEVLATTPAPPIIFTVELDRNASTLGAAVVINSEVVSNINSGIRIPDVIDDQVWEGFAASELIPPVNLSALAFTDTGSRLDVFRSDPEALKALSEVANGNVFAAQKLDGSLANLLTAEATVAEFNELATGQLELSLPQFTPEVDVAVDLDGARELLEAAVLAAGRMVSFEDDPALPVSPALSLDVVQNGLLRQIDPEQTVLARVSARIDPIPTTGEAPRPRDVLDPIMAYPRFNDPMWRPLRDVDHRWLLSGLDLVPPDTATLVETNPAFVAAHMIGLNHEIMRELLWREYPTDQRGTPFHRFWGRTNNLGEVIDDIGPVHGFSGSLVENLAGDGEGEAVLLIRSELLRRYPGSIIYLSRATQVNGELRLEDESFEAPIFRGTLLPDVTFVGFAISTDELRATAEPRWWFVIAQPPSEPRFGLDNPPPGPLPALDTAANLTWGHFQQEDDAAFVQFAPPILPDDPTIDGLKWGASAAAQASLTYQQPVRVAIRASDLMTPIEGEEP